MQKKIRLYLIILACYMPKKIHVAIVLHYNCCKIKIGLSILCPQSKFSSYYVSI